MMTFLPAMRLVALLFFCAMTSAQAASASCGREGLAELREQQTILDKLQLQIGEDFDADDDLRPQYQHALGSVLRPKMLSCLLTTANKDPIVV
jgi:hypothetical protein